MADICAELGIPLGDNSLEEISVAAGFVAPYKVSNFYGYSSEIYWNIYETTWNSSNDVWNS